MAATLKDIQKKYGQSVYPLYKDTMQEPYMPSRSGIGYQGVVLYDERQDKIMSNLDGRFYKKITPSHVKMHGISSVNEYKEIFGLNKNIPLINRATSFKLREVTLQNIAEGKMHDGGTVDMAWKASISAAKSGVARKAKHTTAYKNRFGLCDAQIASRLTIIKEIVDRADITSGDILKYDKKLYYMIYKREGGIAGLIKYLKIIPSQDWGHKYEDAYLLGMLRKHVIDHGEMFKGKPEDQGLPHLTTYIKHFGSWRRAKTMAGLDSLLQEGGNL